MALIFQANAARWDLRKHMIPGGTNKWFINRYFDSAKVGTLVLFWSAIGNMGRKVSGLYGWGIVTGKIEKAKNEISRVPLTYIERWVLSTEVSNPIESQNAGVDRDAVELMTRWNRNLIFRVPTGTVFPVTQEELFTLYRKHIRKRYPDSQFFSAIEDDGELVVSKFVSRAILEKVNA